MQRGVRIGFAAAALGLGHGLLPGLAAAKPPPAGVLVPGKSLGGLRLGMSQAQVRAAWGADFGRCRNCPRLTWYYNYARFQPQGAGVEFRDGRVAAIFTLRAPSGWHTPKRLTIGEPQVRITELYGALLRVGCGDYDVFTMPGRATTAFYVLDGTVYGFGLSRADLPVCR